MISISTDPRPRLVVDEQGAVRVAGVRCTACGYPAPFERPRCPVCFSSVAEAEFGPGGTVWASTVLRIPVPGREPPYAMAYVDLDDGPRVLAQTGGDEQLTAGSRVELDVKNEHGDVVVRSAS